MANRQALVAGAVSAAAILAIVVNLAGSRTTTKEPQARPHATALAQPSPHLSLAPAPASIAPPPVGPDLPAADLEAIKQIQAQFVTGNYNKALSLADQFDGSPQLSAAFHTWLKTQLPIILVSAGWTHIRLGDCDAAVRDLIRADVLMRSPETSKGLAYCYQRLGQPAAADEQFEAYFAQRQNTGPAPDDQDMQLLYADALETQGRFAEAVKALEVLTGDGGEGKTTASPELKKRLEAMRSRSRESRNQTTDTSRFFTLTYRIGEHEDLAAFVLETLEQALEEFTEDVSLGEPKGPIEVVLYPVEQFQEVVVGGPPWAEGVFDGRLRIPIRQSQIRSHDFTALKIVLRHELVHALDSVLTGSRGFPPWFEEGLAQRLSCPRSGCPKFEFPATPGEFLPVQSFQTPYISLVEANAGMAYRQSLYLIYAIEFLRGGFEGLRSMIKASAPGSNVSSDGILAPLGIDFATLHRQTKELWDKRTPLAGTAR